MEFVHAYDFGNFLSFFDGVVADCTIFVYIGGIVGHESDFVGFGVLLIK